jgi:hypothetical protein
VSPLPTDDEVRQAMTLALAQARHAGRRPTVTAVERELGITHPTFYRNYPDLIAWFKQQPTPPDSETADSNPATAMTSDANTQTADLRRENHELRDRVALYAEAIRQLTLDNAALRTELDANAKVIDLNIRQRQRTTDRNEDPS